MVALPPLDPQRPMNTAGKSEKILKVQVCDSFRVLFVEVVQITSVHIPLALAQLHMYTYLQGRVCAQEKEEMDFRLGGLFLIVIEPEKSKVKALADLVSGEYLLLSSWTAYFTVSFHGRRGKEVLGDHFYKVTNLIHEGSALIM